MSATAIDSPPPPVAAPDVAGGEAAAPLPPRNADLEIRIQLREDAAGRRLHFEVTAGDPALDLQDRAFAPVVLSGQPQGYFERFYGRLAFPEGDAREEVESLCASLAVQLLPPDLHQRLWELQGRVETLWIRSDEAWIPWEILKLRGWREGRWIPGPFLCEAFQVTRWRERTACPRELPLGRLAVVLGSFEELEGLAEERRSLAALPGVEVALLPPRRREILSAMDGGSFDAWHFAGHGEWHGADPAEGEILLGPRGSGERIRWRDVEHEAPNFCAGQPLVFLNVCHLGRGERDLVHWGGWTARLVERKAGAVLAALWPVDDRAAAAFARAFYERFLAGQGQGLGEAVRQARLATRKAFPEDPAATWLAFTAFGHPLAVRGRAREIAPPAGRPASPATPALPATPAAGRGEPARRGPGRRRQAAWTSRPAARWLWAAAALALVLLTAAALAGVRTATRVRLELAVDRLAFTAGGTRASPLTGALPLTALTLARFGRLEMYPRDLSVLDPSAVWRPIGSPAGTLSLVARDKASQVSIEVPGPSERADPNGGPGLLLGGLQIDPGSRVVLHATWRGRPGSTTDRAGAGAAELGIEVAPAGSLSLAIHGLFTLVAERVEVEGVESRGEQVSLRGRPRDGRPVAEVSATSDGMVISAALAPAAALGNLLERDLPITALDLLDQDGDGEWRSTLAGGGTLRYSDASDEPLAFGAGELLAVGDLRDFHLRSVKLVPGEGPLHVVLEGVAGEIRSGSPGHARDLRLSLYRKWVPWRFHGEKKR